MRLSTLLRPGIFSLAAAAVAALLPAALAAAPSAAPNLPSATRGPVLIAFSPDGALAVVTEADTGTLAVLDAASGRLLRRLETGGREPFGVAVTDAGTAVVSNRFSGSVALLDLATGARRAQVPLRGEPCEVALSTDGRRAFVAVSQLDEVAVLALPSLAIEQRIPVGRRPQALARTPDGRYVVVAALQSGDVSVIDTAALRETRRVRLTGINLRGVAITPSGDTAFITGQIPANTRVTRETLDIWTNTLFRLDLRSAARPASEGWIDFSERAAADPDGIAALAEDRIAVAVSGLDEVLAVRTPGPHFRTYDPVIEQRVPAGARPRGMALAPGGKQLWVANELDSTLSVLDAATLRPLRRVELGVPPRLDHRLEGRYLFGSARLTRGQQFSCNSCHPDGKSDGLPWEFIHVADGLERRNSRYLRGGITLTAPFRWSGHDRNLEEFLQDEIVGLLQAPRQPHGPLHALWAMLDQFPLPSNPYREADGRLTAAAQRGKLLFEGRAGCAGCHAGEQQGGTGKRAWVGTTSQGQLLDVPHLRGVYDSAPYLHDARAATLEEVLTRHNASRLHGSAHALGSAELADLLRYVREL